MQALAIVEMRSHQPLRLRADVVRPRVQAKHPDRAGALFADVRVLAVGRPPAGRVEDRSEEILDKTSEGPFRRVAHGVVREPRERIGNRREDRAVLLSA